MQYENVDSIDFAPFGFVFDMHKPLPGQRQVNYSTGLGWSDAHTDLPVIDTPASLGYTRAEGLPAAIAEMERHFHSQEALFCQSGPIVFLVAPAGAAPRPNAAGVRAVCLRPGQMVVLHRGVWHSAARGLEGPTAYYYLAQCYKNEPTEWQPIQGGPVEIEVS